MKKIIEEFKERYRLGMDFEHSCCFEDWEKEIAWFESKLKEVEYNCNTALNHALNGVSIHFNRKIEIKDLYEENLKGDELIEDSK